MKDQDMVWNCVHSETDTNILMDLSRIKILPWILILCTQLKCLHFKEFLNTCLIGEY